eukprot:CAMPEP_0117618696 /NCGR_PEP_ID=MMETSP0784-20121206/86234_1 /TAXON_ID=39447 /ORGANISM="" /LENGTH=321 /DNA_ID=CAMNT_0005422563 /DNA_START=32 /DNA_END=997 /DNA_ORIENTATION=+
MATNEPGMPPTSQRVAPVFTLDEDPADIVQRLCMSAETKIVEALERYETDLVHSQGDSPVASIGSQQFASLKAQVADITRRHGDPLDQTWQSMPPRHNEGNGEVMALRAQIAELTSQLDEARRTSSRLATRVEVPEPQVFAVPVALGPDVAPVSTGEPAGVGPEEFATLRAQVAHLARQVERSTALAAESAEARALRAHNTQLSFELQEARRLADANGEELVPIKSQLEALSATQATLHAAQSELLQSRTENARMKSALGNAEAKLAEATQQLAFRDAQLVDLNADLERSRRKVREVNEEVAKVGALLLNSATCRGQSAPA